MAFHSCVFSCLHRVRSHRLSRSYTQVNYAVRVNSIGLDRPNLSLSSPPLPQCAHRGCAHTHRKGYANKGRLYVDRMDMRRVISGISLTMPIVCNESFTDVAPVSGMETGAFPVGNEFARRPPQMTFQAQNPAPLWGSNGTHFSTARSRDSSSACSRRTRNIRIPSPMRQRDDREREFRPMLGSP